MRSYRETGRSAPDAAQRRSMNGQRMTTRGLLPLEGSVNEKNSIKTEVKEDGEGVQPATETGG